MRATLFLILKIAILVAIAVWLANRPGSVQIVWQGYVVEISFAVFVLAIALLMAFAAFVYWMWRVLIRSPATIARSRMLARRERGYEALTQGLVAVAAGDAEGAKRLSKRASVLLDGPPLTQLLSAQAAQLGGDEQTAHERFEAMAERPETEFLGLRGLLGEALRNEDWLTALDLANRARRLNAETPWLLKVAMDLEIRLRKWLDAQSTLAQMVRAGRLTTAEGQRIRAAILMERSREAEGDGELERALELAGEAARQQPDLVPAVARAATLLGRLGKTRQASKMIEKMWASQAHPELAAIYRDLGREGEDPVARVKRLETLHKIAPQESASLLALAEAEMEARLFGAARAHLTQIAEGNAHQAPTRRVFRRLAELEVAETGNGEAARRWLERATQALADPAWVCDVCGAVSQTWSAICPECGAFASMSWRSPNEGLHLPTPVGPTLLSAMP